MVADKIRPAALKVGIRLEPGQRFGFHDFRHSLATFLVSRGKDVKRIQGLLRHAKVTTTLDLYSHEIDPGRRDLTAQLGYRFFQPQPAGPAKSLDRCRRFSNHSRAALRGNATPVYSESGAPSAPISPITGEELQVKFLSDSEENSLKY